MVSVSSVLESMRSTVPASSILLQPRRISERGDVWFSNLVPDHDHKKAPSQKVLAPTLKRSTISLHQS